MVIVIVCVLYVSHTTELNKTNMGIRKLPVAPFTAPSGNTTKNSKFPSFIHGIICEFHIYGQKKKYSYNYGKFMV